MAFYVLIVTYEDDKKKYDFLIRNKNKIFLIIYLFITIVSILTFFEDVSFDYRTGVETNPFIFISLTLYLAFIVLSSLILYKRKHISKKKALPLYLIMGISIVAFGCGVFKVPVVLMFGMMTMINHLMYHTIENPDMKLVNELTFAK